MASVMGSDEPPDGSQKPKYFTPAIGARSNMPREIQASTASRLTNASTSVLNSAMYSDAADEGSRSIAASMVACGNVGFMVRVAARQTRTGAWSCA